MVLTSYNTGLLEYVLFSIDHSGVLSFLNASVPASLAEPSTTFIKGNYIYSYIKGTGANNDKVYSFNIADSSTSTTTFPFQNFSIQVSPYTNKALAWS